MRIGEAFRLVIAAIVFWNSSYIADAEGLHEVGSRGPDTWLAHRLQMSWEHISISLSGHFLLASQHQLRWV
jgi:hypothetical protein